MLVEKRHIECLQYLKIIVATLVPRRLFPIHKVIIQRQGKGVDAVSQQLDGETFGEGGLARSGRAGNEYQPYLVPPAGDLVGDLGDALFVQCLRDENDLADATIGDGLVQPAHRIHAEQPQPFAILAKDGHQLRIVTHR